MKLQIQATVTAKTQGLVNTTISLLPAGGSGTPATMTVSNDDARLVSVGDSVIAVVEEAVL